MFLSDALCRFPDELAVPSIFDEDHDIFDLDHHFNHLFDQGLAPNCLRKRRRAPTEEKFWTHSLPLTNYSAGDISIKNEDGKHLVIHAKRTDANDDFMEVKKTVILPENIDKKQLHCTFTKEGLLLAKAPYVKKAVTNGSVVHDADTHGMVRVLKPMREYVVKAVDGSGGAKFVMDLPLAHFEPGEVTVKHTGNNEIVVEANHEVKGDGQVSRSHFYRLFTLPDTVDGAAIAAFRTDDHVLRLEAPVCATVAGMPGKEIGIVVAAKSPQKATPEKPVDQKKATPVKPVEPMETTEATKSA